MPSWLMVLLATTAVYRVSRMIVAEEGPGRIFELLRRATADDTHWLHDGIRCPLCVSFWLSLPAAVMIASSWQEIILLWLGVAGLVTLIYRRLE